MIKRIKNEISNTELTISVLSERFKRDNRLLVSIKDENNCINILCNHQEFFDKIALLESEFYQINESKESDEEPNLFDSLFNHFNKIRFQTEQQCIDYLTFRRWPNGVISPFDSTSKVYTLKDNNFLCFKTAQYFTVRTGTIFEDNKISLKDWFEAIQNYSTDENVFYDYLVLYTTLDKNKIDEIISVLQYTFKHPSFLKTVEEINYSKEKNYKKFRLELGMERPEDLTGINFEYFTNRLTDEYNTLNYLDSGMSYKEYITVHKSYLTCCK